MGHVDILRAWIATWNARDADALVGLADQSIELDLPMGARRGIPALRELAAKQTYGVRIHVARRTFGSRVKRWLRSDRSS